MEKEQLDTERKIKESARKLFLKKGFAATKTREIAEDADINLALLNYYFRSKKRLYEIIMIETIQGFVSGIVQILNNQNATYQEKIDQFVHHYSDLLSNNPNLINFIVVHVREHPEEFIQKLKGFDIVIDTPFFQQFEQEVDKGNIAPINPLHLLMNLVGMVLFPYLAKPILLQLISIPEATFSQLIEERKELIPQWIQLLATHTPNDLKTQ